ncbi:MAG: nucleotidyltransferase [Actinomycetota bacterium]|nr:nucleotidyltransferase [Actinomycetota bacterium]
MDPKDEIPAVWPEEFDAFELLRRLTSAGVDFVVIGGIAVILHGSARVTRDLDIVFAPDDANIEALGHVLVASEATLRGVDETVPFTADAATLRNVQLLTLETNAGWFDVHRRPDGAPPYEGLRKRAERMDVGGFSVLVASVDDMLAMKRAAGRAQDLLDIETLDAIKHLRKKGDADK